MSLSVKLASQVYHLSLNFIDVFKVCRYSLIWWFCNSSHLYEFIENNWNEIPLIILLSLLNMPMYYKYIEKKKKFPSQKKFTHVNLSFLISHKCLVKSVLIPVVAFKDWAMYIIYILSKTKKFIQTAHLYLASSASSEVTGCSWPRLAFHSRFLVSV